MSFRLPRLGAALSGVALAVVSAAASAQPKKPDPLWEIGAFAVGVSQQAYPGADEQVRRWLALPFLIYRGPLLRIDRGSAALRALKTPNFELDVGFAGAFGSHSDQVDARRGLPDLGTLVEFGPRLKWKLGAAPGGEWRAELPLRGVFDVSDGMAHRGVAFEPEIDWDVRTGGWHVVTSAGAVFGNRKLASTFYRVAPSEAIAGRPAYEAEAGLIALRLGVLASRRIGADWRVFGFGRIDSLAGAANRDSPLVRRHTGGTAGIGVAYTWMRSERTAAE